MKLESEELKKQNLEGAEILECPSEGLKPDISWRKLLKQPSLRYPECWQLWMSRSGYDVIEALNNK